VAACGVVCLSVAGCAADVTETADAPLAPLAPVATTSATSTIPATTSPASTSSTTANTATADAATASTTTDGISSSGAGTASVGSTTSTSTVLLTPSTTASTTAVEGVTSTSTAVDAPSTTAVSSTAVSSRDPVSGGGTTWGTGPSWEVRPPSDLPAPPLPDGWAIISLATTSEDRSIDVWARLPQDATRRVLVIGGIHGNEPVTPPIVRSLVEVPIPADTAVWLVPAMNPDGVAAGTRLNGRDVDLNRNFDWRWESYDGGPGPVSETETAAMVRLIDDVRPDVVVWIHQPLGYVSSIGTTADSYEQAWARGSGVRVRPDVTQHGGGESWANRVRGFGSLLVEVDGWDATPEIVAAHRNGFAELLSVLG